MSAMTVVPLARAKDRDIIVGVLAALEEARPPATELPWHHIRLSQFLPEGTRREDLERLALAGKLTHRRTDVTATFAWRGHTHGGWSCDWFGLPHSS
jgi:hypothetical protein